MKIIYYTPSPLFKEHFGVMLDEATIASKEGNEVYFLYNSCPMGICTINMEVSSYKCKQCKVLIKKGLRLLPKSVHQINLNQYWTQDEDKHFEYKSTDDIKQLEYKSVKIGYAALSSYYTMFRNLNPKIDERFKNYFDRIFAATCHLTDALDKAIKDIQPDRVCFFNARYFEWRPPYDLAMHAGIEAISIEMHGRKGEVYSKTHFVNSTPHSLDTYNERYMKAWNDCPMSEEEKIKIGKDFFERRRNGISAGDVVYTSNQRKGLLPSDWDEQKTNIVIFNSSEDEFAAIGDEYAKLALFKTQYQGIRFIMETLKDKKNVHVYLRVHPNLAKIPYRYHRELMRFSESYDNITVIPGADAVSTYDLMDAAEKVVVFGSTMGLEATYWGKPVILLAGAGYYHSGICYVPKTESELRDMLLAKLAPKNNYEAIRIAFYMLYKDPKEYYKYVDFNFEDTKFLGVPLQNVHYRKLFGSSKLYALYFKILCKFHKRNNTMIDVPTDEDMECDL